MSKSLNWLVGQLEKLPISRVLSRPPTLFTGTWGWGGKRRGVGFSISWHGCSTQLAGLESRRLLLEREEIRHREREENRNRVFYYI